MFANDYLNNLMLMQIKSIHHINYSSTLPNNALMNFFGMHRS